MSRPPFTFDWRNPPRIEVPIPTCARCGGQVEGLRYWFSPPREGYVVEVSCHGEVEQAVLPISIAMEGGFVSSAVAFVAKLEGPENE